MNRQVGDVVGFFDKKKGGIEYTAWKEGNRFRLENAISGTPRQSGSLQHKQFHQFITFYRRYTWKYFLTFHLRRHEYFTQPISTESQQIKTFIKRTNNTLDGPNEVRLVQAIREKSLPKRYRKKRFVLSIDNDIEFIISRLLEHFLGKYWAKMQKEWLTILVVREGRGDDQHFHLLIGDHPAIEGLGHMTKAIMRVSKIAHKSLKRIYSHEIERLLETPKEKEVRLSRIRDSSNNGRRMMDMKDFPMNLQQVGPTEIDQENLLKYLMKEHEIKDFANNCLLVPGGPYFPVVTSAWNRIPQYINPEQLLNNPCPM